MQWGLNQTMGQNVLIHIGLNTVKLNGEFFKTPIKADDKAKVDLEKIKEAGFDIITPVMITNTDDFSTEIPVESAQIDQGEQMIVINK